MGDFAAEFCPFLLLGYLDSNQEQLMRAEMPAYVASHPQLPRDFARVGEPTLLVPTCCYGLILALSEGLRHPKWHPRKLPTIASAAWCRPARVRSIAR
jgi:hypothetical protein